MILLVPNIPNLILKCTLVHIYIEYKKKTVSQMYLSNSNEIQNFQYIYMGLYLSFSEIKSVVYIYQWETKYPLKNSDSNF